MQSALEKSSTLWRIITESLASTDPVLAETLARLWQSALPHYMAGHAISPVHHIPHVVSNMIQITDCESVLDAHERRLGVIAALFHDIGIADAAQPKITEQAINEATPAERRELVKAAIAGRLAHMQIGAEITGDLLADCERSIPLSLDDQDRSRITTIVATHDNNKLLSLVPMQERCRWIYSATPSDWLRQCHWEADSLWMLSTDGVDTDLARRGASRTAENRHAQRHFNFSLQQRVVEDYSEVMSADAFAAYGFRGQSLYRTAKGHELAMQRLAESRPPG